MPPIKLFDILSTLDPPAFSPVVWQTRLILNYKGIPYQTEWLEYTDVASTLEGIGMPKTEGGPLTYTCPAIVDKFSDDEPPALVSDSKKVAEYLDAKYPERSVGYSSANKQVLELIELGISRNMFPMCIGTARDYLEGKSLQYILDSRKRFLGCDVAELYDTEEKKKAAWEALEDGFNKVLALAPTGNNQGWLFGRDRPVYEDFTICGVLCWMRCCGRREDWERLRVLNEGRWGRLHDSFTDYMHVDKPTNIRNRRTPN